MTKEAYIKELVEDRRNAWAGFRGEVEANRKAIAQTDFTSDNVPEAYRAWTSVIPLPRVPDTVQRMWSIVTDDEPSITRPAMGETDNEQRKADDIELFCASALDEMRRESGRDAWRMSTFGALADGLGVLKLDYLPHVWNGEPERERGEDGEYSETPDNWGKRKMDFRKKAQFPFSLTDVDALTYLPLHNGRRIAEVVEVTKRPTLPTLRAFGVKAVDASGKRRFKRLRMGERFSELPAGMSNEIEVWEHDDGETITYMLDGSEIVHEVPTGYGRPRYFEMAGYTTSSRDPAQAYKSVIADQRELVKVIKRHLTITDTLAMLSAWGFLLEDPESMGGSNLLPEQSTVQDITPGSILRGVKWMGGPTVSKDIKELSSLLMAEADRCGLSSVMYGSGSGTSSGYQVASLQAAAQTILRPIVRNIGEAMSAMFELMLRIIDLTIKDEVFVYAVQPEVGGDWIKAGPRNIKGYYRVNVELKPLLPLDEIAQRDSAIRMVESGLWDPEYALEKTGEQQAKRRLDKVMAYKALANPLIAQRIAQLMAERSGLLEPVQQQPSRLVGPNGQPMASALGGTGGPGMPEMGPMQPMVPGDNMALQPPMANVAPVGMRGGVGGNFGSPVGGM